MKVIITSSYSKEIGIRRDATESDIAYLPKPCASLVVVCVIHYLLGGQTVKTVTPITFPGVRVRKLDGGLHPIFPRVHPKTHNE